MKVFLSWSGPRSRAVAEALNDWLRRVIQAVKPFYSPEIDKGAKWSSEIDDALEGTRFGIICLTPDNLNSIWIHYEAGALSKTKDALIWTFLHGLTPGDVRQPLGKFQHTVAEKGDVLRLLKTINGRLAEIGIEPQQERILEENFELFWPLLEEKLRTAENLSSEVSLPEKPESEVSTLSAERAILDEILETVRSQERRLIDFEDRALPLAIKEPTKEKTIDRNRIFYNEVRITISNTEQDPELVAQKYIDYFSAVTLISTGHTQTTPDGVRAIINLKSPLGKKTIRTLITHASEFIGSRPLKWFVRGETLIE